MGTHSVADAGNHLSELIDLALSGEDVVITRQGHPVVELKPVIQPAVARPVTAADLDWLAARRVPRKSSSPNAAELVSQMRDEDDQ